MATRKNKVKRRVTKVVTRSDRSAEPSPHGRIMVSAQTAQVMRELAKHTKCTLDDLLQRMIQDFVPRQLPELSMIMDDGGILPR